MFVVLIGGSYSGCGKTTLGEGLLRKLGKGWAVIKYTRTGFYSTLISNEEVLLSEGKDTARYLRAGAEEVLWLQSPPENLSEMIPLALERLSHYRGIIIEGNSPIEFLSPDVVVFVDGYERPPKTSSDKVRRVAHMIVKQDKMDEGIEKTAEFINQRLLLREELLKKSSNGKIPCRALRQIAEAHGIKYREVGEMADSLGIKITDCELGCF